MVVDIVVMSIIIDCYLSLCSPIRRSGAASFARQRSRTTATFNERLAMIEGGASRAYGQGALQQPIDEVCAALEELMRLS